MSGYFEFEAQPPNAIPYTPSEVTARNMRRPVSTEQTRKSITPQVSLPVSKAGPKGMNAIAAAGARKARTGAMR